MVVGLYDRNFSVASHLCGTGLGLSAS